MVFLAFYLAVPSLQQSARLQSTIFGVASMQIVSLIVVDGVHLSHDQVTFLHDPPHIELVFFVLFALLGYIGRVQR